MATLEAQATLDLEPDKAKCPGCGRALRPLVVAPTRAICEAFAHVVVIAAEAGPDNVAVGTFYEINC